MRRLALVLVTVFLVLGTATPAHADTIRNREYWLADYGITTAWATTRGAGTTIAIIDSGVDGSHPDLGGAVVGAVDFSGSGSGGGPVAGNDHGTMVAALAAGRGHGSDDGVIGAAPEAGILAISIGFTADDSSDPQVAEAIVWAVDHGADVINMSFTRNTLDWPESWDEAFLYADEHDVVMIAAAGNRGSGTAVVGAPATIPGVLTVGGVTKAGAASQDASSQGITIGVCAPSEQLVGATPGGGYSLWSGTSGAAPIVAGVAALVRAAHPELSAANVIERLISTATPAGVDGVDPIYGYGLVDAAAAVSANVPTVTANPMGDLAEWVRINRRATAEKPPVETLEPEPSPSATALPESSDQSSSGGIFPTLGQWRDVGIPLLLFGVFGISFVLVIMAGVRQFMAARRKE